MCFPLPEHFLWNAKKYSAPFLDMLPMIARSNQRQSPTLFILRFARIQIVLIVSGPLLFCSARVEVRRDNRTLWRRDLLISHENVPQLIKARYSYFEMPSGSRARIVADMSIVL
jgi:hypothetical protein